MPNREKQIEQLAPWFHNLHLPGGQQTFPQHPLGDFPATKWREVAPFIPDDLAGWHALDIGCNAGFYAIELARRGATVTAIDSDPHYLRQAEWAARLYGMEKTITIAKRQVHSLARTHEHFDLVLFMGVFYHLRYPLLALDTIRRLEPRLLVFQSLTTGDDTPPIETVASDVDFKTRHRVRDPGWPVMAFIENTFWNDPTNWWIPNHAAIVTMLRSAGFSVDANPGHEIYICSTLDCERMPWCQDEWEAAVGHTGKSEKK